MSGTTTVCPQAQNGKCSSHLHSFSNLATWESGSKKTAQAIIYK